jgi:molybdopterin converting factor small subunit
MADSIKIKFLRGGGFVEEETTATTVEQLRSAFPDDISRSASVAVNGVSVTNAHALNDGDIVAAVSNNKSGGDE